jgi:hypothetical protein
MVIIRRDGVNLEGHVDFIVRRGKVRRALQYKIQKDPQYADLGAPDEAMLARLPEKGSVANRIPICREGVQAGEPITMPTGPTEAAGAAAAEEGEEAGLVVGGVLDVRRGTREEVVEVHEGANAVVNGPRTYEQTIVSDLTVSIA